MQRHERRRLEIDKLEDKLGATGDTWIPVHLLLPLPSINHNTDYVEPAATGIDELEPDFINPEDGGGTWVASFEDAHGNHHKRY